VLVEGYCRNQNRTEGRRWALELHGYLVPVSGTNVGFTSGGVNVTLSLSSSGGGLFGRPMTRKSLGRFLFGEMFPRRTPLVLYGRFGPHPVL